MPTLDLVSRSPKETAKIARFVGRHLAALPRTGTDRAGAIVLLEGEMGSGKTLFAKYLHAGYGGDPDVVTSPSYNLVNHYLDAERPVYHVDLHRLEDPRHLLRMEYEDFLYLNPGMTIVEWPREVAALLDDDEPLIVSFSRPDEGDEDTRHLHFESAGSRHDALFSTLATTS